MRHFRLILPVLLVLIATPGLADDWSRFRGPNGAGTSDATGLPAEFGLEKNVIWETEVPFGRSSPVIAGDRIFVSATEDGKFVTLALDRGTGKTIWKTAVEPTRKDEFHHDTDSATTTPVTDGSNVYVFFQEVGLVSFDKNGKERWRLELGPFRNFYSIAASPVLAGNTLLMLCDQAEGSFLVAVNKSNGKEIWRTNRPARLESYSTPILYPADGKPQSAIVVGSRWVDAYDLKTGKSQWALGDVGTGPVSSPVLVDDVLYISAPNHAENGWPPFEPIVKEHDTDGNGELSRNEVAEAWLAKHYGWLDHDGNDSISAADWTSLGNEMQNDNFGVYAVRLPSGDSEAEILWNYRKNIPEISTPVVHDGVLYMVEDGIVTSLDTKTGELIKRDRMTEGSPKVYASPVIADGKVYLGTLEGEMVVLKAGGEWTPLSTVDLGAEIWASPAVSDGSLYVRTRGKLYNFGAAGK
jgi:outer membrane protein assembly factor BamB